jgi:protein-disulfide isomerase
MTGTHKRSSRLLDAATLAMVAMALLVGLRNLLGRPDQHGRSAVLSNHVTGWEGYSKVSFRVGAKAPRYTVVEFSDFSCVYCQRMVPVIRQLRQELGADVAFVYRHAMLRPSARPSALATECAARQGVAEALHDELFLAGGVPPSDGWLKAAARAGAKDTVEFRVCLLSHSADSAVISDSAAAANLGVRGTPTFLLNGALVEGSLTVEEMKTYLGAELPFPYRLRQLLLRE